MITINTSIRIQYISKGHAIRAASYQNNIYIETRNSKSNKECQLNSWFTNKYYCTSSISDTTADCNCISDKSFYSVEQSYNT